MGPVVAVEIAPASTPESDLRVLLGSCSAALPSGSCVASRALAPEELPGARAVVVWSGALEARIEVRLQTDAARTLTRELVFRTSDARVERFRSVGLAIATIVDELKTREIEPEVAGEAPAAVPPPPVEAPPAPTPEPAPAPVSRPPSPDTARAPARRAPAPAAPRAAVEASNALEAGPLLATGLAAGAPRFGFFARASHDLGTSPVFLAASFVSSFVVSSEEPSVSWNEVALGGGAHFEHGALRFEVGGNVGLCNTGASAADPVTGAQDKKSAWLTGLVLDGRLAWPASGELSLVAGARGTWLAKRVVITNGGNEIARSPAYSVGATLGARLAF